MIFLDVGAHQGQTLEEVVLPKYQWREVWAFEPAPREFDVLLERFDGVPGVYLLNAALFDSDGKATLYGTNDLMEASLYPGHQDVDATVLQEIETIDVAEFFRGTVATTTAGDCVMKLNCEGAEIAIVDRLIETGEIWKVRHMLIDFDARKVAGREHEPDLVRARLAAIGFDRYIDTWPAGETHQDRVANWLALAL